MVFYFVYFVYFTQRKDTTQLDTLKPATPNPPIPPRRTSRFRVNPINSKPIEPLQNPSTSLVGTFWSPYRVQAFVEEEKP